MSLDSHRRETELFGRALDLDAGEQRAFLEKECAGEREIAEHILGLLARDRASASSLDRSALERLSPPAAAARVPEHIGPYRILGLLGTGGMGIVYRAEQQSPRREVALKVIRGSMASLELIRRFEREAQVLARLDHQGIARIYDAGIFESAKGPEPFVAMEFVAGEPLLTHVERLRLARTERVELLARICDAVAHAHDQGIVHRDLKPSNVLVKADGQPKVLDFGVALIVHGETDASTRQTSVGELIGTLPYMSPEQLAGDPTRVDERSDVYALGVLAYELLAGRLPHDLAGISMPAAARIVTEKSPTRLGELDRTLRGDLETIVGKALEKEHAQRYASVRELASDLRRFLRHEPVRAIPPSNLYYLRRFARRNPALTTSLALAALFLIAGSAVSIWQARRADEGARKALRAAESSTLAAARIAAEHADFTTSRRLLASIDPEKRGWVWNWLDAKNDRRIARFTTDAASRAAAFLPNSKEILTVDDTGTVRRWAPGENAALRRLDLGVRLSGPAAFEREGAFVAGVHGEEQETLTLWDASNGRRVAEIPIAGARPVVLAVAPGGRYVAYAGREAFLWDTSVRETTSILPPAWGAAALDFSTDGYRLACSSNPANDGPGYFSILDFRALPQRTKSWHLASDEATSIALGQDGRLAVAYRNKHAYVFDPDHERIATEVGGSQGPIRAVAFDRTGERLATGTDYGSVCLWNSLDGRELAVFGGASGPVTQVAFSADSSKVLSLSGRETSVWDLSPDPNVLRGHSSYVYDLAFIRGGNRLVSLSFDGELCVRDTASLELLRKMDAPGPPGTAYSLSAARDGDLLAIARGNVATILDGDSLQPVRTLELERLGDLRDLSLSPDGSRLAATTGAEVLLWDVESGALRHRASIGMATYYPAVVFSHDGRRYADSEGNEAVVRNASSGEVLARLEGHRAAVEALAFSPDDTLLASGSVDRTVRLWDTRTWKPRSVLEGHTDRVYSLNFSPDGQMLASGSNDTTIRLWSVALGEELALLTGHEDYVFALAFDPDGSRLASASGDKTVRLWDTLPRSERWRAGQLALARREAVRSRVAERLSASGNLAEAVRSLRSDPACGGEEREPCFQTLLQLAPKGEH